MGTILSDRFATNWITTLESNRDYGEQVGESVISAAADSKPEQNTTNWEEGAYLLWCITGQHIEAETKWLPFRRRHFQKRKYMNFD